MDFVDILALFWEASGSILGSKSCSKFGVFFWIVFFAILGRDATSTGLRWDFGAGVCAAEPPRAAPFPRAEGSYNGLKERKHEIQHALGHRPGEFPFPESGSSGPEVDLLVQKVDPLD